MATDVEQLNEPSGEAGSSGKHRKTILASYSMSLRDSGTHSAEISWILCQFTGLCSLYPLAYFGLVGRLHLKLSVLSGSRCQRCIYRGIEGEGHWLSHTTQPSMISKHAWTDWICSSVPFQWNSYHRQGNVAFKRASLLRQVSHQCLGAHLRHLHLFSVPLSCKQPSSGGQQQESNIWAKPSHTTSRLCGVVRKRML